MTGQPKTTRYYTMMLNIGKADLGWEEDFYRNTFLKRHGATDKNGKISAATMNITQLRLAFAEMKRMGFIPKKKAGDNNNSESMSDWRDGRIKKITALWCALADAGVVKDRSEKAMQHWCSRLTHKAVLQWATSNGLNNCIEALKNWAEREHVRIQY